MANDKKNRGVFISGGISPGSMIVTGQGNLVGDKALQDEIERLRTALATVEAERDALRKMWEQAKASRS